MTERFGSYQNELYLQGLGGQLPPCSTDATKLEASAREVMAPGPFSYVAGAAYPAPPRGPTARRSTAGASCRGC